MVSEAARNSAYAEVIAGLLDGRDQSAERRFDQELAAAESSGRLDAETARLIRWWQRESVRGVVDHAQTVLPATLIALEQAQRDSRDRSSDPLSLPDLIVTLRPARDSDEVAVDDIISVDDDPEPPADLTARRLLVAGLMPLRDP